MQFKNCPQLWMELIGQFFQHTFSDQTCLGHKNVGLKIESDGILSKLWDIVCISNCDYAGDLDTRRCVSRFILYILGVIVSGVQRHRE